VSAFLIGRDEISASDEGGDIGIVVTSPVFANAVPRPDGQSERSSLESELCVNPIPASRQWLLTPVGLMDKAYIDESSLQSEQIVVSVNHAHDFRF
jgi:hypothetical protein